MKILWSILAGVLFVGAGTARADTFYSTLGAWQAAAGGSGTLLDVSGIVAPGTFAYYPSPPGITFDGATFTINRGVSDGNLYAIGAGYYYPGAVISSQQSTTGTDDLVISFTGVDALAFDIGQFGTDAVTVTLSDGATDVFTPPIPGLGFFGFVAPGPITSVEITLPTATNGVINVGAPVPEPATALLVSAFLPFLGLFLVRRRLA